MYHTQLKHQLYLFQESFHFQINLGTDQELTPTENQQHVATTGSTSDLCILLQDNFLCLGLWRNKGSSCPSASRIYECNIWEPRLHQILNREEKILSHCHLWQNKTQLPPPRVIYTNKTFSLLLLLIKPSKALRKIATTYSFQKWGAILRNQRTKQSKKSHLYAEF